MVDTENINPHPSEGLTSSETKTMTTEQSVSFPGDILPLDLNTPMGILSHIGGIKAQFKLINEWIRTGCFKGN